MPLQSTSGAASYDAFGGGVAAVPKYIENYFSTFLYKGTDATQTITNNIDLSTKGGLVWIKDRTSAANHYLFDTERGATSRIFSNLTNAASTTSSTNYFQSFNNNGFTVGYANSDVASNYASWSIAKAPKFFDVVTYTGNGTSQNIAHSLGSVPGCIIVKCTSAANDWRVYHRSLATVDSALRLNSTAAAGSSSTFWNSTYPTSTQFTVGSDGSVNANGQTYVAYLFAHDAGGFGLTGTDNVISCGTYTTSGSGTATVSLGYEPQWLLVKRTNTTGNWFVVDTMRGATVDFDNAILYPNLSDAEVNNGAGFGIVSPTATGFNATGGNSNTYIYIAIRRGPMKVPTDGTSVFKPLGTSPASTTSGVGFPADMSLAKYAVSSQDWLNSSRLTNKILYTNSTGAEDSIFGPAGPQPFDTQDGFKLTGISTTDYAFWAFKRAPSFFDEVCYTGTGSNRTVTHNLAAVPELMIIKARIAGGYDWMVYQKDLGNTLLLKLNETGTGTNRAAFLNSTTPTASVFTVGTDALTNVSAGTFVAYLFATCAGVSKVFSYTGNGSSQTINCGFTGGARWILIKRTDSTGDWYCWDSARGIVSGNDPHLSLNTTAAEVTSDDTIDTDSTGFVVNQVSATNVNVSSATYIGIAIA